LENNFSHKISNKAQQNNPLVRLQNSLLELLAQYDNNLNSKRRYTKYQVTNRLAIEKYKETGKGISLNDLIRLGLVWDKRQAQDAIKRFRERKILFTIDNHKPQCYYLFSLKSEIRAKLSRNAPVGVTSGPNHNERSGISVDVIKNILTNAYVITKLKTFSFSRNFSS
jgi:hypothetical protein